MAIITIKINHTTDRGKYFINQIHTMAMNKETVKILYESCLDSEILVNEYIQKSEQFEPELEHKEYMESVYGENINSKNDVIFKKY